MSPQEAYTYQVAWTPDGTPQPTRSAGWLVPIGAVIGIVLVRRYRGAAAVVTLAFGVLIAAGMFVLQGNWNKTVAGAYARAAGVADDSTTLVVEGQVRDFVPGPAEGHQDETFTVEGVRFAYSDYRVTGGFNQTSSHGGPIHEGARVRIRYTPVDHLIVRLEIAK